MIALVALLALLALPVSAAAQVHAADCAKQPSNKPFSLVLTTKTPRVWIGTVPEFAVTLTNCSGKTLNISAGFPQFGPLDTSYSLDITDPKGNRVFPGFYHKFKPGELAIGTPMSFIRMLPAGHAYTEPAYNLSWRYKFDEVGKYRIQVSRELPNKAGVMVLKKSNVITITVLLPPGAHAPKPPAPHPAVRQMAKKSLTLIKPSDPAFDGLMDTYFPGLSDVPAYKTSLRPFLVILRNETAQTAVAYSVVWTRHYPDSPPTQLRTMIVNRPFATGSIFLPPGGVLLVSPMFNLTPKQYAQQRSTMAKYPVGGFPWDPFITSVSVDIDGVVYGDGTFIGPDKTLVLQRYTVAQLAVRDEALAALNLINSSTAAPYTAEEKLKKMFLDQLHWEERAQKHTLLALYVRARGSSALDLDAILRRRGLPDLRYALQKFVERHGGDAKPSSFALRYRKLSPNDPRVFWVTPQKPKAESSPKQGQPFTLTLAAPKQPFKAGKPIILRVVVKNTSDRSTRVPVSDGVYGIGAICRVHVRDQRGRPIPVRPPPREPGEGRTVVRGGSIPSQSLGPGESFTDLVNVTDEYDLGRPGKYNIWVAELLGTRLIDGLVKSNTVTVTVVK